MRTNPPRKPTLLFVVVAVIACLASAPPADAQTFTPTGMATLNGTPENSITLASSADLSGSFPYLATRAGSASQNMITVVGLLNGDNQWVGGAPQVVYNAVPSQSGSSGTASWSNLVVPSTAGTYQLWFQCFLATSTSGSINSFEESPPTTSGNLAGIVATVVVQGNSSPPSFTPTAIATLNGTQENSITLLLSADLSGSFPYLAADGGSAGQNMITVVGLLNSDNHWVGGAPQVVYNAVPSQSGSSGTASWSNLVVPSSAGTYQLWFQSFLATSTSGSINSFEESPPTASGDLAGIVATVVVGNPPSFTPTAMATLNGTQENSITLAASADLTGSVPYFAADGGSAGQNMITVIGLLNSDNHWVGGAPQVVYNAVPSQSGSSGTASWSNLVVPSSAGTYQLWFQSFLATSTSGSINSFEESPPTTSGNLAGIVATVVVGNPPTFTPTAMATLNGTQENSITLLPSADLSGSFPYLAADGGSAGQNMITVVGMVNSDNQWVGGAPQIVYNAFPSQSRSSGTASWSNLVVPSSAGTYQLWFQSFLTSNAIGSTNSFEESPPTASGDLAGIVATVIVQGSGIQLNQGLVAWYQFNGNANDTSGSGNDLTVYGATLTSNEFGTASSAYSFDGATDYLQIDQFNNLPMGSSARTVNAFFKVSPVAEIGGNIVYWGEEQAGNGSSFSVGVWPNSVWSDNFFDNGILYTTLDQNWHMVTVTCGQSDTVEDIYLDAALIGSFTISQPLNTQQGILRVGARRASFTPLYGQLQDPYGGVLGEVRVYNRVLNSAEIQQIYQYGNTSSGLPTVSTGAATTVTANSATLNGSVNPNNSYTTAYFQWGTSKGYGSSIPFSPVFVGSDTSTHNVYGQDLSGLNPNTIYHYQLVANNSAGTAYGKDQTFTTLAGAPPSTVSATLSSLAATPPSALADGSSQITATVTLRDENSNTVAGKSVTFYASEVNSSGIPARNSLSIQQPVNSTDANGQTDATITANTSGTVTITAIDTTDNISVQHPVTVTFLPTLKTVVPPNAALQNAIVSLYQGSAAILNGTPSAGPSLATIATNEGAIGHYFYIAASQEAVQAAVDSVVFVVTALTDTEGLTLLEDLAIQEGLTVENVSLDQLLSELVKHDLSASGVLVTRAQNVSNICNTVQEELQFIELTILSGVQPGVNDNSGSYINGLYSRQQADQVLQQYARQVQGYFSVLQTASQSASQGNFSTALLENSTLTAGATISGDLTDDAVPDVGVALGALTLWQEFQNEGQDMDAHIALGFNIAAVGGIAIDISNNVNAAFSEIAQNLTPNPITGKVLNPNVALTTVTKETSGSWLPSGTINTTVTYITSATANVTVENDASSGSATFNVYAEYAFDANNVGVPGPVPGASYAWDNIPAGQSRTLTWTLFDGNIGAVPSSISPFVNFDVLAANGSGIYYIDSKSAGPLVRQSPLRIPIKGAPTPLTSNTVVSIENPIRCYINQNPSNQTYQAQIWVDNPFILSLTATVTQPLASGMTVLSTDGTLQSPSLVWTNSIAPSNAVENSFTFSLAVAPGTQTNLPPPTVLFSDTNGNSLLLQGVRPSFSGLFPVQAYASVPFGISGVDSPMQVTVTNLTSTNQAGSLTISITDSTGNAITNFSESFSVGGSDSTNLEFALPGSLPAGSYSVTGSLSVNGGTGQVLAGTYVLPAPPIMLAPASTTPFTSNGFSMALQGPAGNYLIEVSSDISNPTNWQPILFYSSTNSPFYYYFTDPTATNFNQQFYRAVTQ